MGDSENLERASLFSIKDGQRKAVKRGSANIGFQLDLPAFWRMADEFGQGLELLDQSSTQSWNLRFVITD